jgi:hypothetical protein
MLVLDEWLLTAERAAIHRPTATAVIADLHLGYSEARRRSGEAVPLADPKAILATLDTLRRCHGVESLAIAGDLVENRCGFESAIRFLDQAGRAGIRLAGVVPGNHDRGWIDSGLPLPLFPQGIELGRWLIVHGDQLPDRDWLVHGHLHPWLRRRTLDVPCYLIGDRRLILPAFSRDAAGVNVLAGKEWRGYRCAAVGPERVIDLGTLPAVKGLPGRRRLGQREA